MALGIACAYCSQASPISEVGTAALALPCMCAGLREHFGGLPYPMGEHMDTSHPLLQRSPLSAPNTLPSPWEDLSRGFFCKM